VREVARLRVPGQPLERPGKLRIVLQSATPRFEGLFDATEALERLAAAGPGQRQIRLPLQRGIEGLERCFVVAGELERVAATVPRPGVLRGELGGAGEGHERLAEALVLQGLPTRCEQRAEARTGGTVTAALRAPGQVVQVPLVRPAEETSAQAKERCQEPVETASQGVSLHVGAPLPAPTEVSPWSFREETVLLAFALACSDYDLRQFENADVFYQDPPSEVDILMIVDNSCSMSPYQANLARNFNEFITFFDEANVDYHIAVGTTTVEVPEAFDTCSLADVSAIPAGGYLVGDTVITNETVDADQTFANLVSVGTCGNGQEMGLESALMAVSEPLASSVNAGFLREDASLSLIFVSDEEDASPRPTADYINTFYEVKGHRDRDVVNASALVVKDLNDCFGVALESTEGTRYLDVASQTNGIVGSICEEDFSDIVTELSLNASRLNDTFVLSAEPAPSTLQVSIDDDDIIPCDDGQWTFVRTDDDEPAVAFDRSQMPPPSSQISIRYDRGSGDVDEFCTGESEGDEGSSGDTGGDA